MQGEQIGSYRLEHLLGEGGMGEVYHAIHVVTGRPAAIKVLKPARARDPQQLGRFLNEARATARIRHPSLVDIFEVGQLDDGRAFLMMELLEGEGLGARIRRLGRLAPEEATGIARQIASALEVVHGEGVIHRDLKPDNIFLVPDAELALGFRVKVLDFGIAKLRAPEAGDVRTHASAFLGTPAFMSPEQCRAAGQIDHRSDVYSLGCLLFNMLCGRPPFVGAAGDVALAHLGEPPPSVTALAPSTPAALGDLVARLLAKQPEARPQRMADVVQVLEGLRGGRSHDSLSAPPGAPSASEAGTLGGAVGEVVRREPRLAGGGLAVALAVLVSAGMVAGSLWIRSRRDHARGLEADPVVAARALGAVPASAPLPVEETLPLPAPAAKVTLRVETTPAGAEVLDAAGAVLGQTPFALEVARDAAPLALRLRKPGFREQQLSLARDHDVVKALLLTAVPPAPRAARPAAKIPVGNPFDE